MDAKECTLTHSYKYIKSIWKCSLLYFIFQRLYFKSKTFVGVYISYNFCSLNFRKQFYFSEKPNPCVNLQCGYGFTCLVTSDGLSASCHCPERCSNFGDHETSRPLCGSDGLTYDNHCEMLRKSCSTGTLITGKHDGRCGKCFIYTHKLNIQ